MKQILAVLLGILISTHAMAETEHMYDLVIYGGTSAAITAAVQASRDGLDVVIVCSEKHIGGMSASGLGATDSGKKSAVGGLSLEFYKRLGKAYGHEGKASWLFEPHVAEYVFEDWVKEYDIPVCRDEWLNRTPEAGVELKNGRIVSITMLSGNRYRGKVYIDATYEGDLMAAAGVSYTVGREANSQYNETLNGVQHENAVYHQFKNDISAYVVQGDPDSGLLPRVSSEKPGEQGEADHRVQAYNYRMCLTRVPENRVPFPKPVEYDPSQYELLLRDLLAGSKHYTGGFVELPNGKTDTNNNGSFSTDNIGMNYDYPEAGYERRREILEEHRVYQMGYCYFLANDPRVPEDVRAWYSEWGLAKDEFVDNGHWPYQIYVREARRMVGVLVVNENHLRRKLPTPRPIGMGSYNMDSHNVQRYVDANGFVRNEGDVQVNPGGPYPIDYGAITPKQEECENLFVVCAVSSSHIAYGSIRMEPVFMILGQSAATAADLAIDKGIPVQEVKYDLLRDRLLHDGQVLPE